MLCISDIVDHKITVYLISSWGWNLCKTPKSIVNLRKHLVKMVCNKLCSKRNQFLTQLLDVLIH